MQRLAIDWQMLCLNLRKHKPLTHLADEIGCDEQTINRLARGDVYEPRYSIGTHLLNAHFDLCGAEATKKLWI